MGGENRVGNTSNTTDLALVFQGASWTDSNMMALQVANALLGDSNAFRNQIRRPSQTRSWNKVLSQNGFVDSCSGINFNFSDSGLWGVRISGQSANVIFYFFNKKKGCRIERINGG